MRALPFAFLSMSLTACASQAAPSALPATRKRTIDPWAGPAPSAKR